MGAVRCIVPSGDVCGEGLVWSAADSALYWTDINRFLVHRYDTREGTTRTWLFDEPVVALSLSTDPDRLLVALASRLIWWWPATDKRAEHGFVLSDAPRLRLNDGRADPLGNFWVGSMINNVSRDGENLDVDGDEGVLYRIAPDGSVTTWLHGLGIPNTVCWSPDHKFFYTGDTRANTIYRFAFHARTGEISDKVDWFAGYEGGVPDGSAMDSEGYLWNCRFFGKRIVRISPGGNIDSVIEMPVSNVTTAAFGGPDLKTLFVTSASVLRQTGERLAGSLWAMDVDAAGSPESKVRVP